MPESMTAIRTPSAPGRPAFLRFFQAPVTSMPPVESRKFHCLPTHPPGVPDFQGWTPGSFGKADARAMKFGEAAAIPGRAWSLRATFTGSAPSGTWTVTGVDSAVFWTRTSPGTHGSADS